MIKLLGLLDIFSALVLISFILDFHLPVGLILATLILLPVKASIALFDPGGLTDIFVAVVILFGLFFSPPLFLFVLGSILMTVKGIKSLTA